MSNRNFLLYGGVLLGLVTLQVGILVVVKSRSTLPTVLVRATNVGVPLGRRAARVTVLARNAPSEIVAEGQAGEALEVPAGRYDVDVHYILANDRPVQRVADVGVQEGERVTLQVDFSSGELEVDVEVGNADPGLVVTYIYAGGDASRVIATLRSDERALLSAGTYDLRVVLTEASEEKGVTWLRDVVVEPGLSTRRAVAFRRGVLRVQATNAGSELPPGAVELTLYRSGDLQLEEVERGFAGVPLSLEAGRYDVKATYAGSNDRPEKWLRDVAIEERHELDREVGFSAGTILVVAEMEGGRALEVYDAYVYYYKAGDHEEAVAYTPAGESAILSSGRYDVRASFYRSHDRPSLWVRGVELEAGGTVRETVSFPSGRLLIRAFDGRGEELVGDNVFVYVFASGELTRPVAAARSGEEVVVLGGTYDVRVEDTRAPDAQVWLNGLVLRPGALLEESVTFP